MKKKKQDLFLLTMIFGVSALILLTLSFIMPSSPTYKVVSANGISEQKDDLDGLNVDNIRPSYIGIVVIDPGHGGYDCGALSSDGKIYEKNIDLEIALIIKTILENNNVKVIMTRDSDEVSWPSDNAKDLQARLNIAENNDADMLISIHCNFSDEDIENVSGSEVYVNMAQPKSVSLADSINSQLKTLELPNRGLKTASLHLTTYNKVPTVLVEMGFISNSYDVNYLTDSTTQSQMALAIANGILDELKADE